MVARPGIIVCVKPSSCRQSRRQSNINLPTMSTGCILQVAKEQQQIILAAIRNQTTLTFRYIGGTRPGDTRMPDPKDCFRSQDFPVATSWPMISISMKNACSAWIGSTGNREAQRSQRELYAPASGRGPGPRHLPAATDAAQAGLQR